MARSRRPNKDIEAAVQYAESQGWRCIMGGHWGRILCPHRTRDGCWMAVNSTPRNPFAHAQRIREYVDKCPHKGSGP